MTERNLEVFRLQVEFVLPLSQEQQKEQQQEKEEERPPPNISTVTDPILTKP